MAFGKRGTGDISLNRPPLADDAAVSDEALLGASGVGAVRTRVSNPGEIDRNFILLAIGVVVAAGTAAIAIPSLLSAFGGGMRPIEQVIAGLDRNGARQALAVEAFPDADGRAFMTSLAANFPREHGRLLDSLADTAMAGGDRDDLYQSVNAWGMEFAPSQAAVVGRTGAQGFNEGIRVIDEVLVGMEAELGGCTGDKFQRVANDTEFFKRLARYDGRGYHIGMRANRAFVELAAAGRKSPAIVTTLNANDNSVLQAAFLSMLGDPQVSQLFLTIGNAQGNPFSRQDDLLNKLNFCKLGHAVLLKMKDLPDGTKSRLFGMAMSQDLRAFASGNPFNGPTGNLPVGFLSGR